MTGIICINKEKGFTSFDVVAKLRGIVGERKAGHTGTLDPMATGVLPVMLGGATKFLDYIPDSDKAYRASFILGKTTDTLDITGSVISEKEVSSTIDDVERVLDDFRGEISQLPPMYSAVCVNGKRLYDLARKGIEVERKPRRVEIKRLELRRELCSAESNEYVIDVLCSKGTYVRTLIDDIGASLGCGAVMSGLERTLAMGFSLDRCITFSELQALKDNGGFENVLINVEEILGAYDDVCVSEAQARRFSNGGALDLDRIRKRLDNGLYRVYSRDGLFLGLGECNREKNELAVKRLLKHD